MNLYHVLEMIGEGSFGRVYKGRKKFSGQVVALKFIPKTGRSEKELRSLKREIEIMRGLRHPNIVLLLDSFETETEVVVVTEYAEGELFQILEDDGSLPECQVHEIACQLVSALYYLHSHRILHRDMKPQNILLGKGGVVKLCDFGFARAMSVSTMVLTSIKGTPLYMSPELVEEKPYDHTADLWSLGCILYELHTGAPPFYTNSIFQLVHLIVKDPVKWPENMGQDCTSFLKGLLTKDPQKRLSWPNLLQHPFVADGVLVLSDEGGSSPLTVTPTPDMQALKQQQVAEKTAPHGGESRLLRKAKERREEEKRNRSDQLKNGNTVQARSKTAPAGKVPTTDSCKADHNLNQQTGHIQQVSRVHSAPCKGQISRDYEREFPSVEVGPRQVLKHSGPSQASLASVRMDSEVSEADSDEEWQRLAEVTDWANQVSLTPPIHQRLKDKLLTSKDQLLDGTLEGEVQFCQPLRVLRKFIMTSSPDDGKRVAMEIGLPHILFGTIQDILRDPDLVHKPWSAAVLGDLMCVLILYWERNADWEMKEKRPEELCQSFVWLFLCPDLNPLAPLAACVLTLFTHRGVSVEVDIKNLISVLECLLTDSDKFYHPVPPGWALCDGVLSLILYSFSERESDLLPDFMESELWRHLWAKVGTSLGKSGSKTEFLSCNGLYVLLSLALFLCSREPHGCVQLFSDRTTNCVLTLSRLLTADCSTEFDRGLFWGDQGMNSLTVISCHLLCFPFALQLPQEKMMAILQSYQSSNIVTSLVQVIQTLHPSLLELPLLLLCRVVLSDPQRNAPCLITAAKTCQFFSQNSGSTLTQYHLPKNTKEPSKTNGHQSKRLVTQTRASGEKPKHKIDQSKASQDKHSRNSSNAQSLRLSKSRTEWSRGRMERLKGKGELQKSSMEALRESLDRHSGGVEQLIDSLDPCRSLTDHLQDFTHQRRSRVNQLWDSLEQQARGSGDFAGGNGACLQAVDAVGQSPGAGVRTVSSLLSVLLQTSSLSSSAAELLSLLSQTARFSPRPSLSLLPVDPALLQLALRHHDDGVRAACCGLLGCLEPDVTADAETKMDWTLGPSLFHELIGRLVDPAPSVRRWACRAVGNWICLISSAGPRDEAPHKDRELPEGSKIVGRSSSVPVLGKGLKGSKEREGRRRGSQEDSSTPLKRGEFGMKEEIWIKAALGATAPLVSLLRDADAVIRQHCCVSLGNLAAVEGGVGALLDTDAPRLLLDAARGDSHHAVRRAARATVRGFCQQDALLQALSCVEARRDAPSGIPECFTAEPVPVAGQSAGWH
ncbi:serine/threonine-protein kinase 36 [Chanos chanos]|uniref:non-specific serine/threonine protein kinase n=1 Tax=Chanos chanos TaxID=29144 RepID=A0A6J2WWY5_CHACN|nr:serine/threonine-protein kinase 36 [Chanos chanos]